MSSSDDTNAADMDNPQMIFTGNWTEFAGPDQCQVDNDHIRATTETNASMSWPFKLSANTLDIIGSGLSTSGPIIEIQIDDFNVSVDTSSGSFPLAEGATIGQVEQCSYIASIGGITPGVSHTLTITHRGPGNNTSGAAPVILTLSTLNWRQDAQDSRTNLHLIASPSTNFPPSSSSSSSTSSTPTATPGASNSSNSSSHPGHTTALAVGVAISMLTLLAIGVFFWLHFRRRRNRLPPRRRRSHVKLSPEDSLRSSFNSIIFEKPSPVVKTDSQRPILRSYHVPQSLEAVELSPIRSNNTSSYHEDTTQGSSPATTPLHTPQRRISRKPVPRSSDVDTADSGVLDDPFMDPPTPTPYRPRPDSDTLARRDADGRSSSEV